MWQAGGMDVALRNELRALTVWANQDASLWWLFGEGPQMELNFESGRFRTVDAVGERTGVRCKSGHMHYDWPEDWLDG